jgi:pyridinium-3,5-biscarboxylic acid mononucleotide synthase
MTGVLFDYHRAARIGLPEAVLCEGKPAAVIAELIEKFRRGSGHAVLFTRLAREVFYSFSDSVRGGVDYHELSRTAFGDTLPRGPKGKVAVVSAGTADGPVTWEAARTLAYLRIEYTVYEDAGVAGLWRIQQHIDALNQHDVVLVVAGLDAALASVVGGLTSKPVIAVPTSVGYGMAKNGETALHSMLTSCAPGITVQNIDNGYGAACAAARVLNLICT